MAKQLNILSFIKYSIIMLMLGTVLSACSDPNPDCYAPGDFGTETTQEFTVYAQEHSCMQECTTDATCVALSGVARDRCVSRCRRNDGIAPQPTSAECSATDADNDWLLTGMNVSQDALPTIRISGNVLTCYPNPLNGIQNNGTVDGAGDTANYYVYSPTSGTPNAATKWVDPDLNPTPANQWNPQNAHFRPKNAAATAIPAVQLALRKGEKVVIEVTGEYWSGPEHLSTYTAATWGTPNTESCKENTDVSPVNNCPDDPNTNQPSGSYAESINKHEKGEKLIASLTVNGTAVSYDLGVVGGATGGADIVRGTDTYIRHEIVAKEATTLQLTYEDTNTNIADNHEGYTIHIWTEGCHGSGGKFLQATVGGTLVEGDLNTLNLSGFEPENGATGEIALKIVDDDTVNGYMDHYGSYTVSVSTPNSTQILSSIASYIIDPIMSLLYGDLVDENSPAEGRTGDGVVQMIYNNIVTGEFRNIVGNLLVLYIVLWGLGFVMGVIDASQYDFVLRILKIGIVSMLLRDGSWEFFSSHLFNLYIDGGMQIVVLMSGYEELSSQNINNPFAFMDATLGHFFTAPTWYKILSLCMTGAIGILYSLMIIIGVLIIIVAFMKAILLYLMSIIAIALLLTLAPIFITFKLFSLTQHMFDSWLGQLAHNMMQPVMLFITLILFNQFIIIALHKVLSFGACWNCVLNLMVPLSEGIPGLNDIPVCLFSFWLPWGYENSGGDTVVIAPVAFYAIIMFIVIADATYKFIDWAIDMAGVLTGELMTNLKAGMNSLAKATGVQRLENRVKSMPKALGKAVAAPAVKAGRLALKGTAAVGKKIGKDVGRGIAAGAAGTVGHVGGLFSAAHHANMARMADKKGDTAKAAEHRSKKWDANKKVHDFATTQLGKTGTGQLFHEKGRQEIRDSLKSGAKEVGKELKPVGHALEGVGSALAFTVGNVGATFNAMGRGAMALHHKRVGDEEAMEEDLEKARGGFKAVNRKAAQWADDALGISENAEQFASAPLSKLKHVVLGPETLGNGKFHSSFKEEQKAKGVKSTAKSPAANNDVGRDTTGNVLANTPPRTPPPPPTTKK